MKYKQLLKRTSEKGQSIIIIALVFVGLLAFIGLTVDVGVLFISYGNLRRAVDNAALASATRMRDNYETEDLQYSAAELLQMNNVSVTRSDVNVETCATTPGDIALCPTDKRKLVRVTATVPVKFSFLPVIGFYSTNITASAIAEAASMDVVLVIDNSESMAKDPSTGSYIDPATCNYDTGLDNDDHPEIPYNASYPNIPGECHPFEEVKAAAAYTFGNWVLNHTDPDDEEDRVAVVVFSSGFIPPGQDAFYYPDTDSYTAPGSLAGAARIPIKGTGILCPSMAADGTCPDPWMNSYEDVYNLITNMQVYSPPDCGGYPEASTVIGSCEYYDWVDTDGDGTLETYQYVSNACPLAQPANPNYMLSNMFATNPLDGDSSTCQTTNIGGGLRTAASVFATKMRKDALWLVVLLTDGAANATNVDHESDSDIINASGALTGTYLESLPLGYCPAVNRGDGKLVNNVGCRDLSLDEADRHDDTSSRYDADDYARDMADLVSCAGKDEAAACSQAGQGAILYAIGLGNTVVTQPSGYSAPPGDTFMRYASAVGDDGNPATTGCTDPFDASAYGDAYNCGNYYFTRYGSGLADVFDAIAARVYTRITR
jgi:Flp pilus assembly protein TadG